MSQAGQDHLYKKVELAGASIDEHSGAVICITEPHALAHAGKMFHASAKITGILTATTREFLFKNPAANYPHIHRIRTNLGSGNIDIVAYEAPTTTADGTPIPVLNTNRPSIITPNLELFASPTVTVLGTEIHRQWVPPTAAGVGQSASGVQGADAGEEWVLAPSTNYLYQITNNSGSTISAWIEVLFYEL